MHAARVCPGLGSVWDLKSPEQPISKVLTRAYVAAVRGITRSQFAFLLGRAINDKKFKPERHVFNRREYCSRARPCPSGRSRRPEIFAVLPACSRQGPCPAVR